MIVSISDLCSLPSSMASMDVDDEANGPPVNPENQKPTMNQASPKKKHHGNRKLQRYRRKLRKQEKIPGNIVTSSATSVDPTVSTITDDDTASNGGKRSFSCIEYISIHDRCSFKPKVERRAVAH